MKKNFYNSINTIALSKNGSYFIISGETNFIGKYNSHNFGKIIEVENEEDVYAMILSNDEKVFYLGGSQERVIKYCNQSFK